MIRSPSGVARFLPLECRETGASAAPAAKPAPVGKLFPAAAAQPPKSGRKSKQRHRP
jgi:hypothetical protein